MAGIEQGVSFPIKAADQFSAAFDKLTGRLTGAQQGFAKFGSVIASIGAGLGAGAFGAMIKSVADAGDAAVKSAQKAGVGIEAWQQFEYAAKMAGVGSQQLITGLKQLGDITLKAADGGSEAQDTFKRLGIAWADSAGKIKSTDRLLLEMAERFATMPEGIEKTAMVTRAFGKAGIELLPFLNQGAAGIESLMREAVRLGVVMDGDTSRAAEALNDNLQRLQTGTRGLVVQAIAPLLPFLEQMSGEMAKSRIEGEGMSRWTSAATSGLRLLGSGALATKALFEALGNTLGGLGAAAAALFSGEFARARDVIVQMRRDNVGIWEKLGSDLGALWDGVAKSATQAEKPLRAIGKTSILTADQVKALAAAAREQQREWAELARLEQILAKASEDARRAGDELIGQLVRGNRDIEFEIGLMGESKLARELSILSRQKEKDLMVATSPAQRELIEQLYKEREALVLVRDEREGAMESQRQQMGLWEQAGDVAGQFFSDLVTNGKSAFDNLRKWVKQLLADMVALFAKRWVLNMAAGGSVWGAAGDALAGGLGSDSLVGAGLNWVGGALGLTGGAAAASGLAVGTAATGAGIGAGVTGTATISMGGGAGALSGVYSALASIPVWGWIAMAVIAIGAWLAGEGGGPKVGGSFFQGGRVPGTDNGRFFTPSQGDDAMRQMVEATSRGYTDAIARLGGNAGAFNFGLGFDHDPQGSARSRVSSLLTDASGRRIYGVSDREMDDKEVEGALGLEMQRMIIAALQESGLHDELDAYFDGIGDVSQMTAEQLQAVLAGAIELKGVIDVLALWDNGLTVQSIRDMAREGETLTQTLNAVAQAQATYYQLFYTEEENLARNTEIMRKQFEAIGMEMPQTREAFRSLVESLDLTTESGAQLYRWLLEIAPAFADLVPAIEDTADVVDDVADSFDTVNQVLGRTLSGVRDWEDVFERYYAGRSAREALGRSLDESLLGPASPLDPMQRLAEAQRQYEELLGLAQGGDIDAISRLGGARNALLDIARQIYGSSSPFVALFNKTFDESAKIAEVATLNERMLQVQTDSMQYQAHMADTLVDVRALLKSIANGIDLAMPAEKWERR